MHLKNQRQTIHRLRFTFLYLSLLLLAAAGCRGQFGEEYRPPTAAAIQQPVILPSPTATILPTESIFAAERPTATPACTNNLRFLEDLSIPDSSLVAPGEKIDKRWRLKNSGSCNWDQSYGLRLVAGPELDAQAEQSLFPARGGTAFSLRIIFTAPNEPGVYRSAWQAHDPSGQPFGDPFFVEITVGGS